MDKTLFQFRSWQQAAQLQTELSKLVIQATRSEIKPRLLCGLDMAYLGDHGFASAVLWDLDGFKVTAKANSIGRVHVGYNPGFLGFRECPLLLSAARKLQSNPDVFLVDGHGRSHPRRFGLACQIGLALNRPTIGVAKSHFYGLIDGENITGPGGELLGKIVTASNGRNHYVSVGHLIQLEVASQLVEDCMVNNHPAPLREAHLEADRIRRLG